MVKIDRETQSDSDVTSIEHIEARLEKIKPFMRLIQYYKLITPEAIRIEIIHHALTQRLEELKFLQPKDQPHG